MASLQQRGVGRSRRPMLEISRESVRTTPCTTDCQCTSVLERSLVQGARPYANHQRCRTGSAACTAESSQARLKAIAMHGSTATTPQIPSRCGGLSDDYCQVRQSSYGPVVDFQDAPTQNRSWQLSYADDHAREVPPGDRYPCPLYLQGRDAG